MMNKKEIKRLMILNIPYVILGLLATNLGEAWRLAAGTDISEKILALFGTIPAAFGNPLPSMHPADLCVGLVCGVVLRYIFVARMQKSTGTMWSMGRRVGERQKISSRLWCRNLRIM